MCFGLIFNSRCPTELGLGPHPTGVFTFSSGYLDYSFGPLAPKPMHVLNATTHILTEGMWHFSMEVI